MTAAVGCVSTGKRIWLETIWPAGGSELKFEYVGIRVRDLDKAVELYTKMLGLEFLRRRKMEWTGGEIAMLRDPQSGQMLELNWYPKGEYRAGDELDHLGFEVDDAEAFLKKLEEAGCKVAYLLEERGSWLHARAPTGRE